MSKILIIDDEKSIRNALRDILEYEKHEITEAADGLEAIEQTRRLQPDVVLLDLQMPRLVHCYVNFARLDGQVSSVSKLAELP